MNAFFTTSEIPSRSYRARCGGSFCSRTCSSSHAQRCLRF